MLVDFFADEFKRDQGIDLRQDTLALQRLKEAAEKAKHELSTVAETDINLPFITADASGPKHLNLKLSRAKFESLCAHLIERLIEPCRTSLKDAGVSSGDVDEVILVGGMTRMPAVQEKVKEIFGKEASKNVNPDEAVAMGAAIQAGVLQGDVKDVLLLDVTPLSLGIETYGGVFTKLIDKNTTIPTRKSQVFSTAADNQPAVSIHVMQGEREMADDNKTLGRFELVGIPPAPRGVPQVEVTFDIDSNGIVHVSAKDLGTGKEQSIKITASSGLTDEEIDRMVREGEEHAEEDRIKRELVDVRNTLDSLVYSTEKSMSELGDKLSDDMKSSLDDALAGAKAALEANELDQMKTATEKLTEASHELSKQVYENAAGDSAATAGEASGASSNGSSSEGDADDSDDDDTIEADFEEVKGDSP